MMFYLPVATSAALAVVEKSLSRLQTPLIRELTRMLRADQVHVFLPLFFSDAQAARELLLRGLDATPNGGGPDSPNVGASDRLYTFLRLLGRSTIVLVQEGLQPLGGQYESSTHQAIVEGAPTTTVLAHGDSLLDLLDQADDSVRIRKFIIAGQTFMTHAVADHLFDLVVTTGPMPRCLRSPQDVLDGYLDGAISRP